MFTVAAMPVKYVGLLLLFAWCAVWCVYELTRPQDARQRVSNVLHLAMAVVMLLMVDRATWMPLASVVGIPVLAGFFALATGWFVVRAIESRRAPRPVVAHLAGHAAMFGAMTWHLAAMGVKRAHMGPDMPRWVGEASRPGGELWCVWNSPLAYRGSLERLVGPTRQVARDPRFTVTVSTRR